MGDLPVWEPLCECLKGRKEIDILRLEVVGWWVKRKTWLRLRDENAQSTAGLGKRTLRFFGDVGDKCAKILEERRLTRVLSWNYQLVNTYSETLVVHGFEN